MEVLKMDNKGRGITYYNNKIVFINNALPSEDVDITLILDKKRYSIANVKNYIQKSKDRIKPKCPYFNNCGGCQLQHLSYKKQINYKFTTLKKEFNKIGIDIVNKIIFDKDFYYRNKLTLQVNNNIGLYSINSNDIVNIEKCIICDKLINEKIKYLKLIDTKKCQQIIIKSFNEQVMLVVIGDNDIILDQIIPYFDVIYVNSKKIKGDKLIANIGNIKYYISPNTFFQVNPYVTYKMYNHIKNLCINNNSKNVLDLYCGCGSISLFISKFVDYVYGIEINSQAIKDANDNKKLNKINNVSFECDDAGNITISNKFDTIIVDPPRNGLDKRIIKQILENKIANIIYVSCNPITLIRDLELLLNKYNIKDIQPFDMFPNTYHVECICHLILK